MQVVKQELLRLPQMQAAAPTQGNGDVPQTQFSRQQVQSMIGVDVRQMESSLQTSFSGLFTAATKEFDIEWVDRLIDDDKFQNWFQGDKSGCLVLLESFDKARPIYPLPLFCDTFLSSLKYAVGIYYFCSAPLPPRSTQGPYHLLRCLVAQILEACPASQAFLLRGQAASSALFDFDALWTLFIDGIQCLPSANIICVINGPQNYPDEDELQMTIERLLQLLNTTAGTKIKLKLLLTSPISPSMSEKLPEGSLMDIS
jgi:hypothetical protein